MKTKYIIASKFNIMNANRNTYYATTVDSCKTKEWIDNRLGIYMNFTANSLINQTDQDFTALLIYNDLTRDLVFEALNKFPPLPDNFIFVSISEFEDTLKKLIHGYDILYFSRLDSDDCYVNTFIEQLHNHKIKDDTEALLCQFGYMYDVQNNKLAEYYHHHFTYYTFIYRLHKEDKLYDTLNITPWDAIANFSHHQITNYKYEVLEDRNFLFNIHGDNSASMFSVAPGVTHIKITRHINSQSEILGVLFNFL
ncbi:MAG: hypothetical protein ACRC7N_01775 [Clostridium sp.]